MDKSALNKIVDSLQKSNLAEGKKLLVSNKVKPDILGGIMVEIGDKSIDLTVSAKLAKLNKLITGKLNWVIVQFGLGSNIFYDDRFRLNIILLPFIITIKKHKKEIENILFFYTYFVLINLVVVLV